MRKTLREIFNRLDIWITQMNKERESQGLSHFSKSEIKILGQMSLLAQDRVATILHLFQTRDIDAKLEKMEYLVKQKMVELMKAKRFVYDEDSPLIWIPSNSKFETLFEHKNFIVTVIDPESALVSKAVKAKEKNKQLIQDAIESEQFPGLVDRILKHGGDLEFFGE